MLSSASFSAGSLILGWLIKKSWAGAWSFIAAGLGVGVIMGGFIVMLLDFYHPKGLNGVPFFTRMINEVLFPVGCSLVLYASESLGKRLRG